MIICKRPATLNDRKWPFPPENNLEQQQQPGWRGGSPGWRCWPGVTGQKEEKKEKEEEEKEEKKEEKKFLHSAEWTNQR